MSPHNREVLQHVILAKKPYERRLRGAATVLYVILVRKPRKLGLRYGLSTEPNFSHLGHFVVRRDSHLFDLGTRGWKAHTFLCLGEGAKPYPGYLGFTSSQSAANLSVAKPKLDVVLATNHVRVLTRDHVLQNLSNVFGDRE